MVFLLIAPDGTPYCGGANDDRVRKVDGGDMAKFAADCGRKNYPSKLPIVVP
jgi:hypothetical protein